MAQLVIRQEVGAVGLRFTVHRISEGRDKAAPTVELTDPLSLPLDGTESRLGSELAWYLESYLDYPFPPNDLRAERVLKGLREWGERTFEALLGSGQARDFYRDATRHGHSDLHIVVASDNAQVLAWPWEALRDPQIGDLAQHCRIERQLDRINDPLPLPENLPQDRIHILLVTARPRENDVAYRSISRPLVELIQREALPAKVTLLRPPTFARLRQELKEHPGVYHIVHFDGHGSFGTSGGDTFKSPQGQLLFEQEDGGEDPIEASQLSQLLREYQIPIAVLNACQSAMLGPDAEDAFASVATALLKAGVRSVVAMGYSLYVSAAREFLPAFYRRLFEDGSVAEATRAGRQALLERPERRLGFPLQDWIVPVLYQQEPLTLDFAELATPMPPPKLDAIPVEARIDIRSAPHGLIGRDRAVLALERASRRPPPALLIYGLGGVGKTTLARGYLEWLAQTQGLPSKVIWQSFVDVRSFDYLRNRLVEELLGTNSMAAPDDQKWPALLDHLRTQSILIVWDNFESASGATDAGAEGNLPAEDRQALRQWLEGLRGGNSHVLITSRREESWLGTVACYRIPLGGLLGEERQALARAILNDQGVHLDSNDKETADLINTLEGHPLMMRAILPKLAKANAKTLQKAIEQYVPDANSTDPIEQKLYATLRYVEEELPMELRPLLYPIGLHEGHLDAIALTAMARTAEQSFTQQQIFQILNLLESSGLATRQGGQLFELHPGLSRYLRVKIASLSEHAGLEPLWDSAFLQIISDWTSKILDKEHVARRNFLALFHPIIIRATNLKSVPILESYHQNLLEKTGRIFLSLNKLDQANLYLKELEKRTIISGSAVEEAIANYFLGMSAFLSGHFDKSENFYKKSLKIWSEKSDTHNLANVYHELGSIYLHRSKYRDSLKYYRRSLKIKKMEGDALSLSKCYGMLGNFYTKKNKLKTAIVFYKEALKIEEKIADEEGKATTYHQLGMVYQLAGQWNDSEYYYRKSLIIRENMNHKRGLADTSHGLGMLLHDRGKISKNNGDSVQAEKFFLSAEKELTKSLKIEERLQNEPGLMNSSARLGILALDREDYHSAKAWLDRSLKLSDKLGFQEESIQTKFWLATFSNIL